MKKKLFLFLLPSLALVALPFASTELGKAPQEVGAANAYVDVASGLSSLSYEPFYLFGAYAEENGTPYMYLMAFQGYGTFVKVPCLSKTDATHPCGISETDFTASCLSAVMMAHQYATSGTDLCFSFIQEVSELYADKTSYEFTGSTVSGTDVTPSVSFDTTVAPETCSLGGWEYQIANQIATFKGYATSVDSGYSTALYVYPVATNLLSSVSAVGFSLGLSTELFTSEEARSTYQGLTRKQRELFAYYRNSVRTSTVATQAVEKILQTGISSYKALLGVSDDSGSGIYASATPAPIIDYASDSITGLLDEETYEIDYGAETSSINGTPSNGAIAFAGFLNNTIYDLAGESNITISIYNDSSLGGGNIASAKAPLTIDAHLAAPTSTAVSLVDLPLTPTENTSGIYDDRITVAAEEGYQYALAPSSTSMYAAELAYLQWADSPSFAGLVPETAYTIYKRIHSATTTDSLPSYDAANRVYLGQEFTTLTPLEGKKKHALVDNYLAYQQSLLTLGDATFAQNLLAMLTSLKTKVEAATSLTDLANLADTSYRQMAFNFALAQDQAVVSLHTQLALASNDSDASSEAYSQAVAAIAALDFFSSKDNPDTASIVSACLVTVSSYRYRESQGKALVDFFNASILPNLSSLTAEEQDKLWNAFDADFKSIMATLGATLDATKTAVDALYASSTSALTSLLKELSA